MKYGTKLIIIVGIGFAMLAGVVSLVSFTNYNQFVIDHTPSLIDAEPINLGAPQTTTYLQDIDELYQKYGEYVQVTTDGRILYKDQEVNENRFKNKIPANTVINTYEAPCGKGYQIEQTTDTEISAIGFGCMAEQYTYTIQIPPKIDPVASTTP